MLVLSRKIGEKLVIGDNITIVVSRVSGNRVMLGIEAPANVRIVRSELKSFSEQNGSPAVSSPPSAGSFELEVDTATASLPRLAK
jgi:carbon storage regulator